MAGRWWLLTTPGCGNAVLEARRCTTTFPLAIAMDRYAHVIPNVRNVVAAAIAEQLGDLDRLAAEAAGDRP